MTQKQFKIKSGYVLLARVIKESAIWQDNPDTFKLFIYLLIEAHHDIKPKRFCGFEVKRGELVTSMSKIAEDNQYYEQKAIRKWSRPKVARMLEKLKRQERIKLIADTYGTHISVCNYDLYQNSETYKPDKSGQHRYNTVTTPCTYNNGNNGNNDNNFSLISPPGDRPPKNKTETIQKVFDHWNSYGGQSVQKRNGQGKNLVTVRWKAHRLLTKDKRQAITAALKDYSTEQICGAIGNFAKVLLGQGYFWTYPWQLHEFLTRGVERHKGAARQFWSFLPDNFDAERYRISGGGDDVLFSDPSIEEAEAIRDKIMARSKT